MLSERTKKSYLILANIRDVWSVEIKPRLQSQMEHLVSAQRIHCGCVFH